MKIEITIKSGTPSSQWLKVANRQARDAVKAAGIEWASAEVYVHLPEAGRCMTKAAGFQNLVAHG